MAIQPYRTVPSPPNPYVPCWCHLQPQVSTSLFSVPKLLPFPEHHLNGVTECSFFQMGFFHLDSASGIHSFCCSHQEFHPPWGAVPRCTDAPIICPLTGKRHLSCYHLSAITGQTTLNNHVWYFFCVNISFICLVSI